MAEKFSIPCDFNGVRSNVDIFIGNPEVGHHPIFHQNKWLNDKGGQIPAQVLESLDKLLKLSITNNVSFSELCKYAFTAAINSDASTLQIKAKSL